MDKQLNSIDLAINNKCYVMINKYNNRYNVFIVYNNKVLKGFSTCNKIQVLKYIEDKKRYYKNLK